MNATTARIGAAFPGARLMVQPAAEAQTRNYPEKSVHVVPSPDVRERTFAQTGEA